MRITLDYCDRCGCQLDCRDDRILTRFYDPEEDESMDFHICRDCLRDILSGFTNPEGE